MVDQDQWEDVWKEDTFFSEKKKHTCLPVQFNYVELPQAEKVRYELQDMNRLQMSLAQVIWWSHCRSVLIISTVEKTSSTWTADVSLCSETRVLKTVSCEYFVWCFNPFFVSWYFSCDYVASLSDLQWQLHLFLL